MGSTIEKLYYGNIPLSERDFKRNGEYAQVLKLTAQNEEKLTEMLTESQKETFQKYKDCTSELESMTEVTTFALGFKLGLRLTAEAFITGTAIKTSSKNKHNATASIWVRWRCVFFRLFSSILSGFNKTAAEKLERLFK